MPTEFQFHDIARLPEPGDNAAIVTRRLETGSIIWHADRPLRLDSTILEGHRFALQAVKQGEALLSWGLPFGFATRQIVAGDYVVNTATLESLRHWKVDFPLSQDANFEDTIQEYRLDEAGFKPARQVPLNAQPDAFNGYLRPGKRGAGTRNLILLLGVTAYTGAYVRILQERLAMAATGIPGLDGIAALSHSEGALPDANNLELLLRTLAGWIVHPNVAAVLVVDYPQDVFNNAGLRIWMIANGYPLADVPHAFFSLTGGFELDLQHGAELVRSWLGRTAQKRQPVSLDRLKIALQCGGSDAFSGISGNPLAAWVTRQLIQQGGSANLSETAELMGAEAYILQRASSIQTATRFLHVIQRFKTWAGWHGVSVEGNLTGGNRLRGLYNIALKAIGAARKLHPDVCLDMVLDYAQPMNAPGFYFMDSPGNDLESIAGQVACGCNLVLFVTGNGSVTNFPFVPTIKIITTTPRYTLLAEEMDVNAGLYLDGVPMDTLGERTWLHTLDVAGGMQTAGERAAHAQAQVWRDWRQNGKAQAIHAVDTARETVAVRREEGGAGQGDWIERMRIAIPILRAPNGYTHESVGLVYPASMCSAQAALMTAAELNRLKIGQGRGLARFVALPHTEGCGASPNTDAMFVRTLAGYLKHPMVRYALVLEHGCEKTHKAFLQGALQQHGVDPQKVGWASVQLDGGLRRSLDKAIAWFETQLQNAESFPRRSADFEGWRLGMLVSSGVSHAVLEQVACLARQVAAHGGTIILAGEMPVMTGEQALEFAQAPACAGLYRMQAPTAQWSELLAGLGAGGAGVILGLVHAHPLPGHPLVTVVLAAAHDDPAAAYAADLDVILDGEPSSWQPKLLQCLLDTLAGNYMPAALRMGNVEFQLTRGEWGISL